MMGEKEQKVYKLASQAVNMMGYACQMAEQQNWNSQCKYEKKSDEYMEQLHELLSEGE